MVDACEIPLYRPTSKEVDDILKESKTIAVVGLLILLQGVRVLIRNNKSAALITESI